MKRAAGRGQWKTPPVVNFADRSQPVVNHNNNNSNDNNNYNKALLEQQQQQQLQNDSDDDDEDLEDELDDNDNELLDVKLAQSNSMSDASSPSTIGGAAQSNASKGGSAADKVLKAREIARIRRQQQKDYTDSLDRELFELNYMLEYMQSLNNNNNNNNSSSEDNSNTKVYGEFGSLPGAAKHQFQKNALAKNLDFVRENAPKGVRDKKSLGAKDNTEASAAALYSLPQSFPLLILKEESEGAELMNDFQLHLASLICSRREAISNLDEKRRSTFANIAKCTVQTMQEIVKDTLPLSALLAVSSEGAIFNNNALGPETRNIMLLRRSLRYASLDPPPSSISTSPAVVEAEVQAEWANARAIVQELKALLNLSPEQMKAINDYFSTNNRRLLVRSMCLEHLSTFWVKNLTNTQLLCTDVLSRNIRDALSPNQLEDLLKWSTANEKILLNLSLESQASSASSSVDLIGSSNNNSGGSSSATTTTTTTSKSQKGKNNTST